jgi:hypothetical protein
MMRYLPDLRIPKNADVEFSCLLRFGIELQKGIYLFHNPLSFTAASLNTQLRKRGVTPTELYALNYPALAISFRHIEISAQAKPIQA